MISLQAPEGSRPLIDPGVNITSQCNAFVQAARTENFEWLWLIGDDHLFNPMIIHNLLAHNVDVVVPNVVQRSAPFNPVVYDGIKPENGHHSIAFDLPETGLHKVFAAGSAGMLVKRHVLDALPEMPFQRSGELQNEDLTFCAEIRDAGFDIWCDVDEKMAHIGTMIVWPEWSEQYGWGATLDIGPPHNGAVPSMPVFRIHEGAQALVAK